MAYTQIASGGNDDDDDYNYVERISLDAASDDHCKKYKSVMTSTGTVQSEAHGRAQVEVKTRKAKPKHNALCMEVNDESICLFLEFNTNHLPSIRSKFS